MISSMIASGSSLRGLSEVTSTRSASRRGGVAHQRALAAVAVAAGAEHHVQAAARDLARRAQHVLERVGRVRVVHEHAEVLALVHRLEAAGHAAEALERDLLDAQRAHRGHRPEHVQHVEQARQR